MSLTGLQAKLPLSAEFTGKARRLIEAVEAEDRRSVDAVNEVAQRVIDKGRPSRKATARLANYLKSTATTGLIGVGILEKRRRTTILVNRVNGDRHKLHDWVQSERALMMRQYAITVTPEFSDVCCIDVASISIHALARAYQRMPQVNDTLIVHSLRSLVPLWTTNTDIGAEFTCNGWRGVVLWQESDRQCSRTDCNGERFQHLLGVRTYFDTQD
jgi:hypothetical protein